MAEASRRGTVCAGPEQGVLEEEGDGGEVGAGLEVRKLVQLKEMLMDSVVAEEIGVHEGVPNEASIPQEAGRDVKNLANLKVILRGELGKDKAGGELDDSEHGESDEDGAHQRFARGAQRRIPEPSAEDLPFGPYEQDGTRERPFNGGDARSALMRLARISKRTTGGDESESDPSDGSEQGDVGRGGESDASTGASHPRAGGGVSRGAPDLAFGNPSVSNPGARQASILAREAMAGSRATAVPGASNSNRHNDVIESEDKIFQQETLAGAVERQRALQVQRQNQSARQHSPDRDRGFERTRWQAASWTEGAEAAYAPGPDRFVSPQRARPVSQSFSELQSQDGFDRYNRRRELQRRDGPWEPESPPKRNISPIRHHSPLRRPVREEMHKLRKFRRAHIEVADCIGKGAYGTVWLAYLMDTNQSVVVKVVWPDEDLDPGEVETNGLPIRERMEAFQREIEMMEMAGRHPNVVTILGATNDSRVIVFEQAKIDLQALIKRERPGLTLPYIAKWTYEILAAVEYLHARCKFVCVCVCVCVCVSVCVRARVYKCM